MFKHKLILFPAILVIALLASSCSGPGAESSSSADSREESIPTVQSSGTSPAPSSDPTSSQEENPIYTKQVSISNDFPELVLKLFAQKDEAGLYHATALQIYHASISNLPMQTIELTGCESNTPDFLLIVEDMNFDGIKDIRLVSSSGAQNTYYNCYVWDIDSASFHKDELLSALPSLQVNTSTKTIHFFEHGSATDYREGDLRYLDGDLTMIREVTQTFDAATNLFTVTTREFEDGSLRITDQKTLTAEELEAQETVSSK